MTRTCDVCGKPYEAKRATSRFCGDTCRKRGQRSPGIATAGAPATPAPPTSSGNLFDATLRELTEAGRQDSALGQAALELARRAGSPMETGQAIASLIKEMRATLSAALADAEQASDPLDELRARRDAKRVG